VPSLSIKAEPPVAVVDKVVDAKGTRKAAEAYLNFLYTPAAQKLVAHSYYRPLAKAQAEHFDDGGTFDQVYQPKSTN
jgi:ABC-type sulfate transport system substrate-binding protein